jgi:ribonuclease HI
MTIQGYIDGASRGNPGERGIGFLLRDERGGILHAEGGYLGHGTNNTAEYAALLRCLKKAREFHCQKLVIHSDSELLVRQYNGEYKVKNTDLKREMQRVRRVVQSVPFAVELQYIPREKNLDADRIANAAIDHHLKTKI